MSYTLKGTFLHKFNILNVRILLIIWIILMIITKLISLIYII